MATYPWPDAPIRTYVEDSTPTVKASDLNDLQDAVSRIYGALAGSSNVVINEDFVYSKATYSAPNALIGRGVFAVNSTSNAVIETGYPGGGAGSENISIGQLWLVSNNAGAVVKSASAYQLANKYGVSGDFAFRAKGCAVNRSQLDSTAGFSMALHTAANNVGFYTNSTSSNWQLRKFSLATSDSGVPVTNDSPTLVETIRVGSTISYYINGILVDTEPFTGGLLTFNMHIDLLTASNTIAVNTPIARVDFCKLEISRT